MVISTDKKIPYGRQTIGQSDIDAVIEQLQSPFLTQGDAVPRFEQCVTQRCTSKFAVAVNSATSALHIACLGLDVKKGDIVWTVPNTFVASANAALYCGAMIDFVDIDPLTFVMDLHLLEEKLRRASAEATLPKVVIAVHFAGQSCDMRQLKGLAERFGFKIIEDAAHALGAQYEGLEIGGCQFSDIAIFSFHPVKIITTGEGGMCVTNDLLLAQRLMLLRSHGITKDQSLAVSQLDGPWDYQQILLGYNYRMPDINAALGISQIRRLDEFLERRRAIAARYDEGLKNMQVRRPYQANNTLSSWHLYVIQVDPQVRRRVVEFLHGHGCMVQVLYIPVHLQPYYAQFGFKRGDFPVAEDYFTRSFTLPIFPSLTYEDQDRILSLVSEALAGLSDTH